MAHTSRFPGGRMQENECSALLEQYHMLQKMTSDVFLELDDQFTFVDIISTRDSGLFFNKEEAAGMQIGELLPESLSRRTEDACRRARETGQRESLEYPSPIKDDPRWFKADIMYGMISRQSRYFISIRDVTDSKQIEQQLIHSRDLQRYIIEHTRSAVAVHDRDLRYIYVSQRYLDDFRVNKQNVIGKHHYEVFPDLPQKWRDVHQRALQGEVLSAENDPYYRDDGTVDWTRWECRPWYEAGGVIGGIIIYTEVITKRKQQEESFRKLNERLNNLIQSIQELSLVYSIEDVAEVVSSAARKLIDADGTSFVLRDGDHCFYMDEDAVSPLWKGSRFPLTQCISGWSMLNQQRVVIEDITADDRIPQDVYRPTFVKSLAIIPINQKSPYGAVGYYWASANTPDAEDLVLMETLAQAAAIAIENVNAYLELEERVQRRTDELKKANMRLKELDRLKSLFIATMSHELRTPLNSIIGFTGILLMGMSGEINDTQNKQLGMVKKSASHLLDLINDVIDVSKIEADMVELYNEHFDLNSLVQEVADSFQVACSEKMLSFEVHTIPGKLMMTSDRRRVKQVLVNLVGNAVKFTDAGGVALTVSHEKELHESTAVHDWIKVSVSDTGIGISPEGMEKLFTAFTRIQIQGQPDKEGTGLGLYLSRRISDILGGTIEAESKPGRGSTFSFRIPLEHKR